LGGRKGIWPVKISGGMLAWLSVCGKVQICIWLSLCHCHSLSLAPVNADWFYLFGIGSLGQSWTKGRKMVVVVVVEKTQEN